MEFLNLCPKLAAPNDESNVLAVIPQFVKEDYNYGPGKLICDDLGLTNLLVKSKDDLTIIEIVNIEWSYLGPAQLFRSAP